MDHRETTEYLLDLAADQLDQDSQDSVQRHIEGCSDCRAWLETHELLASTMEVARGDGHPDSRILALCAIRSEEEFEPDRVDLRRHLEICPQCRHAIEQVRDAVREARPETEPMKLPERSQDRTAAWMFAAAACLAAVVIGALLASSVMRDQPHGSQTPEAMAILAGEAVEDRLDAPPEEFSEPEIEGTRLIETEGGLVISRTHIKGGAEVTIRAGRTVAFGNGFQVGPQAHVTVGGIPAGTASKPRETQNG